MEPPGGEFFFLRNLSCSPIVIERPTVYISESRRANLLIVAQQEAKQDELADPSIFVYDRLVGGGRCGARVLANVLCVAHWCLLFFFLSLHADTRFGSSYSRDFRVFLF